MNLKLCAMSATLLIACASDVPEVIGDIDDAPLPDVEEVGLTPLALAAPFAASVSASGDGCPSGSWNSDVSDDGLAFTTVFSAYELELEPGATKVEKSCKLTIKFNSTTDVQYSVGDFGYSGYANLESQVKARLVTTNKFTSSSERSKTHPEIAGSADKSFVMPERIGLPSGQWTKCGKKETLTIGTTLTLKQPSGSQSAGYVNISSVDGNFSVRSRRCTP